MSTPPTNQTPVDIDKVFKVESDDFASSFNDFVGSQKGAIQKLVATIIWMLAKGWGIITSILINQIDNALAQVFQTFRMVEGEHTESFARLNAEMLGQLLGLHISEAEMVASLHKRGELGLMTGVGGQLIQKLEQEFGIDKGLSEEQGEQAAFAFLGFLMSYAVREGNLDIGIDISTFDLLGDLREMGKEMSKNLGLGRLARRALTPLIQTVIATPYQWKLNRQLRPKLLSEDIDIRAYLRGGKNLDAVKQDLIRQGYRDDDIDALVIEYSKYLSTAEITALWQYGSITTDQAISRLQKLGYINQEAQDLLAAIDIQRTETIEQREIDTLLSLVKTRRMNLENFQNIVQGLHRTPKETVALIELAAYVEADGVKDLTIAEIKTAFLTGLMDFDQMDNALTNLGYNDTFRAIIEDLNLLDLQKAAASAEEKARLNAEKQRKSELTLAKAESKQLELELKQIAAAEKAGLPPPVFPQLTPGSTT